MAYVLFVFCNGREAWRMCCLSFVTGVKRGVCVVLEYYVRYYYILGVANTTCMYVCMYDVCCMYVVCCMMYVVVCHVCMLCVVVVGLHC